MLTTLGSAQTWNEIFRQKKTQRKYHAQQLVALQMKIDLVKRGVEVVYKGLTTIHNIKEGDFNLHRDFFGHFKDVNPVIRDMARTADVIAFQIFIFKKVKETYIYCTSHKNFTAEEIRYVGAVCNNMILLTNASLSELVHIVKSRNMSLTDDERIARLDMIYEDMLDKKSFVVEFDNEVRMLSRQREKEHREQQILLQLNNKI